jgi:hypothetical protein
LVCPWLRQQTLDLLAIVPSLALYFLLELSFTAAELVFARHGHDASLRDMSRYKAFKFDADRDNLLSQMDEDKHRKMRIRVTAGVRYCQPLHRYDFCNY